MRHDPLSLNDERLALWPVWLVYDFREVYVGFQELLELLDPLALLLLEDERALLRR
jgi:hypothetical protein